MLLLGLYFPIENVGFNSKNISQIKLFVNSLILTKKLQTKIILNFYNFQLHFGY